MGFSRRMSAAAILALLLAGGCVVVPIPTPQGKVLAGTAVHSSDLAFLQPAITTKKEVLQRLGKPTVIWRDENIFIYRWIQSKGVFLWVIGAGYQADFGASDITAEYAFLIKFDPSDRFDSAETVHKPALKSFGQFLLDWRDAHRTRHPERKESTR
jgi:outer membrane protein assembly factor BamE (lipoprotein component of BamABCDE complex)